MSKTIISVIIGIIALIFQQTNIQIAPEKIQNAVEVAVMLASLISVWIQRVKKGDVNIAGFRK